MAWGENYMFVQYWVLDYGNKKFLTWIGLSFDAGYVESRVVYVLPEILQNKKDLGHSSGTRSDTQESRLKTNTYDK